ncbi:hypothetical protein PYCCODRAFT_1011680 [Trametes coccinea BRFM310]|uniref:Uncharacterized protein n=1 Tax=Trametes coccinea (strain BRFM310) TaxID=1353009 RepID=A0A1Y2IAS5_TRAC3|nr:hypothetical protein PYCCODRAFT_1011680 [Trametes coccinea BRFM310]
MFGTGNEDINYIVKILDPETQELLIYERLLCHLDDPANHTVPSSLARTAAPGAPTTLSSTHAAARADDTHSPHVLQV